MNAPRPHPQITVIPRKPRRHAPIRATELETMAVMDRVRRVQPHYHRMETALGIIASSVHLPATCSTLLKLACSLIQERRLPGLDRLARRQRSGLICWFCEHCLDLMVNPHLFTWTPESGTAHPSNRQEDPATGPFAEKPQFEPMMDDGQASTLDSELRPPLESFRGYSVEGWGWGWEWSE
jgi:hypothetical protein